MSIAINNYLANSRESVNFEPIKQYGIPVALLQMPPPAPFNINYLSSPTPLTDKNYLQQNAGGENTNMDYFKDSTFDKMFNLVNLNKPKNKTRKGGQ